MSLQSCRGRIVGVTRAAVIRRHQRISAPTTVERSATARMEQARHCLSSLAQDDESSVSKTNPSRYAAVDHAVAYEACMQGRHGKQLELALLEGLGKDDPPFDPFIEEELEEDRRLRGDDEYDEDDDDDDDDDEDADDEAEEEDASGYTTDVESESDLDEPADSFLYNNDGSVRRPKSQLACWRAGAPAGGMFAIISMAGTQFKVTVDDLLIVNRLRPVDTWCVGSVHELTGNDIQLISCSHYTLVGMPAVATATVKVLVEEITQDKKIIVLKKKRRKNVRRKMGFRRDVTILRILDIQPPAQYQNQPFVQRPGPSEPGPTTPEEIVAATLSRVGVYSPRANGEGLAADADIQRHP